MICKVQLTVKLLPCTIEGKRKRGRTNMAWKRTAEAQASQQTCGTL